MNIREIPKIKLAVLGFYAAAMLCMSACAHSAAAEAKEPESTVAVQTQVTAAAAVSAPAEEEENNLEEAAPVEESVDTEEVEEAISYDTSVQYPAAALSDGDAIVGGTYTAEGEDESSLEASGNVTATVTGAYLQKLAGNASSADGASFRGLNSGVRVYGHATVTLTACEILATA